MNIAYLENLDLLHGDLYYDDIKLDLKRNTIRTLKKEAKLETKQANDLYNALPIQKWANNKLWVNYGEIYDKVEAVIIDSKFKLKYFKIKDHEPPTLSLVIAEYEFATYVNSCPEKYPDFEFPYFSLDDDYNYINIFLIIISTIIAQHVYAKWEYINKNACNIELENMFIIPAWVSLFAQLFSGVSGKKFSQYFELNKCAIDIKGGIFYCDIELYDLTASREAKGNPKSDFRIFVDESDLINYNLIKKYTESTINENEADLKNKQQFVKLLDKVFSPKGLLCLLKIFLFIEKSGRPNIKEASLEDIFVDIKKSTIKEYIEIITALSIIKIMKVNKSRAIGFLESIELKPTRSLRTYSIKIRLSRLYKRCVAGYNCYILPDAICNEILKNNKLKFFLLIFFLEQWVKTKQPEIDYKIDELIKIAKIEDYSAGESGGIFNVRQYELLLDTLSYMKRKGFIGDLRVYLNNKDNIISLRDKPKRNAWKDYSITITSPVWFVKYAIGNHQGEYIILKKAPPIKTITAANIKKFREVVEWTSVKLANKLEVSPRWLRFLETGQKKISKQIEDKLHKILQDIIKEKGL